MERTVAPWPWEDAGMRILIVLCAVTATAVATADRMKGPNGEIRDVPKESVPYALKEGWAPVEKVLMRSPHGTVVEVEAEDVGYYTPRGYWPMTEAERMDILLGRAGPDADSSSDPVSQWFSNNAWWLATVLTVVGLLVAAKRLDRARGR